MGLTDEQLAMRLTGIGASESPMILGESPHGGPVAVFLSKLGLSSRETTEAQELGNYLEDGIARYYAAKHPGEVIADVGVTLRHPKMPWMLCSPDRWINPYGERSRLMQIKLVGSWMAHHWTEGVPSYVQIQCQHEMFVTGARENVVAAVIGGTQPVFRTIEFDEALALDIAEACRVFWSEHVQRREAPEPDGSEDADSLLARLYPRAVPKKSVEAPASLDAVAKELARVKLAKKREDELAQKIKAAMGDAEEMKASWWRSTWKENKGGTRAFSFRFEEGFLR